MGFFTKKKLNSTSEGKGGKTHGGRARHGTDSMKKKASARREIAARGNNSSVGLSSETSGYGSIKGISRRERQRFHRDKLFDLGHKHVEETSAGWRRPVADSTTQSTPPGPIPFGLRNNERQMRSREASRDTSNDNAIVAEKVEGTPSWDGRTLPTSTTSCSVFDMLSQYTEALCSHVSNKQPLGPSASKSERALFVSSIEPYSIPREISFTMSNEEPTGYRVLETMEPVVEDVDEFGNRPSSLLERLDRRKRNDKVVPKVKVYVDNPKPKTAKVSGASSVFSALTTPSGVEH